MIKSYTYNGCSVSKGQVGSLQKTQEFETPCSVLSAMLAVVSEQAAACSAPGEVSPI